MNEEHDETMVMYDFCERRLVVNEREGASDMDRKNITMLMDSYSRWRTTDAVFVETGEDGR